MISRQRSAASLITFALLMSAAIAAPTGGCIADPVKRNDGAPCALGTECISGFCVEGACCDTECSGTCEACTAAKKGNGDDGTCASISLGLDPDNECYEGACSGTSSCQSEYGVPCLSSDECLYPYCVGGVCCDTDCNGPRDACNLGGSIGTCVTQTPLNCADGAELTDVAPYSTPFYAHAIVTGDFNGDGQQDVGLRNWLSNYAIAPGQGNGTLGPITAASEADWMSYVTIAADANHNGYIEIGEQFVEEWWIWADFTNDGILDKISVGIQYGDIGLGHIEWRPTKYVMGVHAGNSNGSLTFVTEQIIESISPSAPGIGHEPMIGAADFNGDGNLDVAVVSYTQVTVWLGQGNGKFLQKYPAWTKAMTNCYGVHVADVNQDGHADVMIVWHDGTIEGYPGQGDGTFSSQSLTISGPAGMKFADITKDGKVDLFQRAAGLLQVRPGHGDGTFGVGKSFGINGWSNVAGIQVADMDNDGRNDVVTSTGSTIINPGISIMFNRCIQ